MTMAKPIVFDSVEFAMLQELAKKHRMKEDQYIKKLIQDQYENLKR